VLPSLRRVLGYRRFLPPRVGAGVAGATELGAVGPQLAMAPAAPQTESSGRVTG
jgi:hypothetical protein